MVDFIGHLDCDCYYVSAERVRHPELSGVPCGVLGNQGACVIAKSYELKEYGINVGMPIWDAKRLCPHAVFIKRDFRWYETLSRKLLEQLKRISPEVEYYSVDEMFFDSDYLGSTFRQPLHESTLALQQQVLNNLGLPVSIGIARTRTLAKLGSDASKPFGIQLLDDDSEIEPFLESQPVGELCGIGKKSEQKLHNVGILNCLQFRQASRIRIRNLLTVKGEALWYELHGEPIDPIVSERPLHKCMARGGSVGTRTANRTRLTGILVRNLERLIEAMNHHQVLTEILGLSIAFDGLPGWHRRFDLDEASASFDVLIPVVKHLMSQVELKRPVTHMHILAERPVRRGWIQRSLFSKQSKNRIDELKQQINEKTGRFSLRHGDTLLNNDFYQDEANGYDICDIYGKSCF